MDRNGLDEFLANRGALAAKISSSRISGVFKKRFTVPDGTSALAVFPDGSQVLLKEHQEAVGPFELTLVKEAPFLIRVTIPDLRSSDGMGLAATVSLGARVQTQWADMFRDFIRTLFSFPGVLTLSEIKAFVIPQLRQHIAAFAASHTAQQLHRCDRLTEVRQVLELPLERVFFDGGVRFDGVREVAFVSADYEQVAAARIREEELERQRQANEKRREEKLRRLTAIAEDKDLSAALSKVTDEKLRSLLYAKLVEEAAGRDGVVGETVVRADPPAAAGRGERLYAALGHAVIEIDPSRPREGMRTYQFRDSLRSVRVLSDPQGETILAGARESVFLVRLDRDRQVLEFPVPQGKPPRGGINSIDLAGTRLVASHSEYGILCWDTAKPGLPGERIHPEATEGHRTTRSVQVHGDRLYFASGPHVFRVPLSNGTAPERYVTEDDSGITGVAACDGLVFAGTESGLVVCWREDEHENPKILARRRDPILSLRVAQVASVPHILYSARDVSVRARVIGQDLETPYESSGTTIGLIEAASDVVCATDGPGRRIFFWKAAEPMRPTAELDLEPHSEKPILDLWMRKASS